MKYCLCGYGKEIILKPHHKRFGIPKFIQGHHAIFNIGPKNGMWKGNEVSYTSLHEWINNNKPKSKLCENCGIKRPYDLANILGEYKRDISDYEWLCRRCHMIKDGRLDKMVKNNINAFYHLGIKHKGHKHCGRSLLPERRKELKCKD